MTSITDTQEIPLTLKIDDAAGKPAAAPSSPPVWSSADTNIITLTVAADGMSAVAVSGQVGATTVNVTVPGAPGDSSTPPLTASLDITVTGGVGTTATITAGTPTAIPAATPPAAPAA